MAILQVHTFPDPVLKEVATPIDVFNEELKTLAHSMLETMYVSEGIGLAANQVGILNRIVVIDLKSGTDDPQKLEPHNGPRNRFSKKPDQQRRHAAPDLRREPRGPQQAGRG